MAGVSALTQPIGSGDAMSSTLGAGPAIAAAPRRGAILVIEDRELELIKRYVVPEGSALQAE